MITENKDLKTEQLLRGIAKLCASKDDCSGCPFYTDACVFEEPKPAKWLDEGAAEAAAPAGIMTEPSAVSEKTEPKVFEEGEKPVHLPVTPAAPVTPVDPAPAVQEPATPAAPSAQSEEQSAGMQNKDDDSNGTWIVSTTMGSVLSKYVYICSKCGYKKESYFSLTPMTFCPECMKRREGN